MESKGISEVTVARMAGNIAASYVTVSWVDIYATAKASVALARLIVDEVHRTEQKETANAE